MTQDSSPRRPGDSAPNFDWLKEQDGSGVGGEDSAGDSAVGVLPSNDREPVEAEAASSDSGAADQGESPSSIFSDAVPTRQGDRFSASDDKCDPDDKCDADEATIIAPPASEDALAEESDDGGAAAEPVAPADDREDDQDTVRLEMAADMTDPPRQRRAESVAPVGRKDAEGGEKRNLVTVVLASYASAVTLIAIYLWLKLAFAAANPQHLESLPDVKPIREGQFREYDAAAAMPPGHTLRLGESRRFGNVRVEALRVSREPVEFVHFSGDGMRRREASQPVLKLWLRFTNVSDDQVIVPLDGELLLKRAVNSEGKLLANNFLIRAADKPAGEPRVFVFDHPLTSEWDLKEQHLGRPLQPGESFETYVPSAVEGVDELDGDLLWRVHIRKGHSPKGYGVTTLIEVAFSRSDVVGGDSQTQSSCVRCRRFPALN